MSKRSWIYAAVLLFALALPQVMVAQSCALCYTQAAGSNSRFIKGLRSGILVLIFPPMAICVALTALTWKRRNDFQQPDSPKSDLGW